jgi:hypothetical protein
MTPSGVHQMVSKAGSVARIAGVRCSPHTLRHTFAVNFLRGDAAMVASCLEWGQEQGIQCAHALDADIYSARLPLGPELFTESIDPWCPPWPMPLCGHPRRLPGDPPVGGRRRRR